MGRTKKIISVIIALLVIGSLGLPANAVFIQKENWHEVSNQEIDRKYHASETFVVLYYKTSYQNSSLRKIIIQDWLRDSDVTIYGVDIDQHEISQWALEKISAPSVALPLICIVKNRQEYSVITDDESMQKAQKSIHELLGIYNTDETDFYRVNSLTYKDFSGTPDGYQDISGIDDQIKTLARSLIAGTSDQYTQLKAIHDWVASNIFYDYTFGVSVSARATYMSKRSVCEGYANLTAALCRAAGIPCRVAHGFALGMGSDSETPEVWDIYKQYLNNKDLSAFKSEMRGYTNHAWNEAYVDGRWVILDTTWDSTNAYYETGYVAGKSGDMYFDPDLKQFSSNHLFWGIYATDNEGFMVVNPASDEQLNSDYIDPFREYHSSYYDYYLLKEHADGSKTYTNGRGGYIFESAPIPMVPVSYISEWAEAEVDAAIKKGLVPEDNQGYYINDITRGEFCALVINMISTSKGKSIYDVLQGQSLSLQEGAFTDTDDFSILAAHQLGIVNGRGGGLFAPDDYITRQEAAVMLYHTARALGVSRPNRDAISFEDIGQVADWAKDAVSFISAMEDPTTGNRVMRGTDVNRFSPNELYTKEQSIATILRLFNAVEVV